MPRAMPKIPEALKAERPESWRVTTRRLSEWSLRDGGPGAEGDDRNQEPATGVTQHRNPPYPFAIRVRTEHTTQGFSRHSRTGVGAADPGAVTHSSKELPLFRDLGTGRGF